MVSIVNKDSHIDHLKERLLYEPETGLFKWKNGGSGTNGAGSIAGHTEKDGYIRINSYGKHFSAHRLAWAFVYGKFPDLPIDHVNRDKKDNRIKNLRLATYAENNQNKEKTLSNKSGLKGVSYNKALNKWKAHIRVNYKGIHLGYFDEKVDAYSAYLNAAKKYHTHNPEVDSALGPKGGVLLAAVGISIVSGVSL